MILTQRPARYEKNLKLKLPHLLPMYGKAAVRLMGYGAEAKSD